MVAFATPDISWIAAGKIVKVIRPMEITLPGGDQGDIPVGTKLEIHSIYQHRVNFLLPACVLGREPDSLNSGDFNSYLMGDFEYFVEEDGKQTVHQPKFDSMILKEHPDVMPRHKEHYESALCDEPKFIGYWYRHEGQEMPNPADFVDENWDPQEKVAVLAYLEKGKTLMSWRGFSWCRFKCSEPPVPGTRCKTDGEWVWPEGFAHYIELHDVKPPQEFINKCLGAP